jgi:hypothetical protein
MPGEMPAPSPSDVRVDAPAPPLAPLTAEVLKPKTPAEQLGLTDGQVVARRGRGENAYFDSGWSVLYTGTAIDTMTNQPREEIVIVKPVVDAEGNAVVDDTGVAESITKTYWLDDLMAMQPKPEQAANSGEDLDITVPRGLKKEVEEGGAQEIEGASDEAADLGGAALTTEVAVDADSIPADEAAELSVLEGTSLVELQKAQDMMRALPEQFGAITNTIGTLQRGIESGVAAFEEGQNRSLATVQNFVRQAKDIASTLLNNAGFLNSLRGNVYQPIDGHDANQVQQIKEHLNSLLISMKNVAGSVDESIRIGNSGQEDLSQSLLGITTQIEQQLDAFSKGAGEIGNQVATADGERTRKKEDSSYTEAQQVRDRELLDKTFYVANGSATRVMTIQAEIEGVQKSLARNLKAGSRSLTTEVLAQAGLHRASIDETTQVLQHALYKLEAISGIRSGTKGNLVAELDPLLSPNGALSRAVEDVMRMRTPSIENSEQRSVIGRLKSRVAEVAQLTASAQEFVTAMAA